MTSWLAQLGWLRNSYKDRPDPPSLLEAEEFPLPLVSTLSSGVWVRLYDGRGGMY
jgi:hypothetical protein